MQFPQTGCWKGSLAISVGFPKGTYYSVASLWSKKVKMGVSSGKVTCNFEMTVKSSDCELHFMLDRDSKDTPARKAGPSALQGLSAGLWGTYSLGFGANSFHYLCASGDAPSWKISI